MAEDAAPAAAAAAERLRSAIADDDLVTVEDTSMSMAAAWFGLFEFS